MSLALPVTLSSPQDLSAVRGELHDYAKWFQHNAIKNRAGIHKKSDQPLLSPAAKDLLQTWFNSNPQTSTSLDNLIHALEKAEKAAPQVTITLAAPAMGELKHTLVDWFRKNLAEDILVNFQFNSTILGGMVVRYGSHIFDWSFRRDIMAARGKFPEALRNV